MGGWSIYRPKALHKKPPTLLVGRKSKVKLVFPSKRSKKPQHGGKKQGYIFFRIKSKDTWFLWPMSWAHVGEITNGPSWLNSPIGLLLLIIVYPFRLLFMPCIFSASFVALVSPMAWGETPGGKCDFHPYNNSTYQISSFHSNTLMSVKLTRESRDLACCLLSARVIDLLVAP
jgi:hypothetical protein